MPKIFSERERVAIITLLRRAASDCLALYGVKKTTVEELTRRASIAKGTFYLFYDSKEALFAEVLLSFQKEVEAMYLEMLQNLDENHIVTSLTEVFYAIVRKTREDGIFRFFLSDNMVLISRKVPERQMRELKEGAEEMFRGLFSYFSIEDEEDIASFTDGYMAIIKLLTLEEPIGEKTLRTLIRGLVLQMVE